MRVRAKVAVAPGEQLRLRDEAVAVRVELEEDRLHLEPVEVHAARVAEAAELAGVEALGPAAGDGAEGSEQRRLLRLRVRVRVRVR